MHLVFSRKKKNHKWLILAEMCELCLAEKGHLFLLCIFLFFLTKQDVMIVMFVEKINKRDEESQFKKLWKLCFR